MFLHIILISLTKILIAFPISVSKLHVNTEHLSLKLVTQITELKKKKEVVIHFLSDSQPTSPATGSQGPHLV